MNPMDAQPVLDAALATLNTCRLDGPPGRYRSYVDGPGEADPWSAAAAVNMLYAMDLLPGDPQERAEWVAFLQSLQDPGTGMVPAGDADESLLLTASIVSALTCLDAAPLHPPHEILALSEPDELREWLRELCWCHDPERAARKMGALYGILVRGGETGPAWEAQLFDWILAEADEHTGLLRRDCLAPVELEGQWTLLPYLCAAMYPLALGTYACEPIPLPWRLIDTALEVMDYHRTLFFKPGGQRHLPWVYVLARCRKLTAHRFEEVRQALERFAPPYLDFLQDQIRHSRFHAPPYIQWDIAVLAELRAELPGLVRTRRPLRRILDRHPFL